MTEDELSDLAEHDDVYVRITATGEEGLVSGWNHVEGFLVDVKQPDCPHCGQSVWQSNRIPFTELEFVRVEEES